MEKNLVQSGKNSGSAFPVLVRLASRVKFHFLLAIIVTISFVAGFANQKVQAYDADMPSSFKIVGYLQGWTMVHFSQPAGIKLEQLSHLIYTDVRVVSATDPTLECGWGWEYITRCVTAGHAKGTKVLVSLYGEEELTAVTGSDVLRNQLVNNIRDMLVAYDADGIDIDWEVGTPAIQPQMDKLVADLYDVLHPINKIIAVTPSGLDGFPLSPQASRYVDIVNLALYGKFAVADAMVIMNRYADAGFAKNILTLGLHFDGKDTSGWVVSFADIVNALNPPETQNQAVIDTIYSSYTRSIIPVEGGVLRWNSVQQAKDKVDWVKNNGFGGIMIFDVGADILNDDRSMLQAIYNQKNLNPDINVDHVNITALNSSVTDEQLNGVNFNAANADYTADMTNLSIPVNGRVTYSAQGFDSNNNPIDGLTYTWTVTDPAAGTINSNGLFTAGNTVGDFPGAIQASTPEGITGTASVTVVPTPFIFPGSQSVDEGQLLQFSVGGDNDLTYAAFNLPSGAGFDPASRLFFWTPSFSQAGTYSSVRFQVSDGIYVASMQLNLSVVDVNRSPYLANIGDKTVNAGSLLQFPVSGTDPDGDALIYSASNLPSGAVFNTSTRTFSWTPALTQTGIYPGVRFEVSDGELADSQEIMITVNKNNHAPVLSAISNKTVNEGAQLNFTVNASDPDGDVLTYSASNLPAGAAFDQNTGNFSWTPSEVQAGTYSNIRFSVSDGALAASQTIAITVINVNQAPVLSPIGNKTGNAGTQLVFTVSASDPDSSALTYSAVNLPKGASFNTSTRIFSWKPTSKQAGTYSNVRFQVSDGKLTDSETISITIISPKVNHAPILNLTGNKTVAAGSLLTFAVTASDADNDSLTLSASNLPAGASFSSSTGIFSWTPSASQKNTRRTVKFSVSDGKTSVAKSMSITVTKNNQAPTLNTIGNRSVKAGSILIFKVTGRDADGDRLTYSATGLPAGATFNTSTRTFTWKPGTNQVGTYALTFQVTDRYSVATQTVNITVRR